MKNVNYALLAVALVFCFNAPAQNTVPWQKATAMCPSPMFGIPNYYATLEDANKACGNQAQVFPPKRG